MSERLDIVDENGVPTGETVDREVAHRDGIRHRTSHVWIVRLGPDGRMQVLVQKRAAGKDAFPGCWDISSAGHIPAGDDWVASALRELREELGVEAKPEDLKWLGNRRVEHDGVFHGKPFRNRQVSAVFALHLDRPACEFAIQESEIESVEWTDLDDCIEAVRRNALPNCISLQELRWIKRKVWLYPPGEGPFVSASHGAYKWLSIGLVANFPLWIASVAWWQKTEPYRHGKPMFLVVQIFLVPVLFTLWGCWKPRVYRSKPGPWAWAWTTLFFLLGLFLLYAITIFTLWQVVDVQYGF